MDYETIIRSSNTIFSTMVCPECGRPVEFYDCHTAIGMKCSNAKCMALLQSDDSLISVENLCCLLNNNGMNFLVKPKVIDQTNR